jgi:hypothetical protein
VPVEQHGKCEQADQSLAGDFSASTEAARQSIKVNEARSCEK